MKVIISVIALLVIIGLIETTSAVCPCPRILDPVCGSNQRTYNNKCELECDAKTVQGRSIGLKIYRSGRCEMEPRSFDMGED